MQSDTIIIREAIDFATESIRNLDALGTRFIDTCNNRIVTEIFVGTVMSIMPSGKFYTPWANDNVDSCPTCSGTGEVLNPDGTDSVYLHAREIETELIAIMIHKQRQYHTMPEAWQQQIDAARLIQQHNTPTIVCPNCHGYGSREVYEDDLFQKTLEDILKKYGCYLTTSEGCATDLIVGRIVHEMTDKEIERNVSP